VINTIKKLLSLLSNRERKRLYLLFGAMTISGIAEVAGIAPILPFLSLVTNPSLINENKFLNWLYDFLNFHNINKFLVFTGIMVLLILIISNALMFLSLYGLSRFSWMRNHTISGSLLKNYLYQPYIFFLNKNTTTLGKNILSEVQETINGVLIPIIQIFSRGIVTIFIFALLFAIKPVLAFILLALFGGSYILIYKFVRQKLNNMAKQRFKTNAERFRAVNESFIDIKQLKLFGSEKFFLDNYSKSSLDYAKNQSTNLVISLFPRHIMEVIVLGGMVAVVLYLLISTGGFQEFLPLLGLYAFATYRLVPGIQVIFAGVAQIRFNHKALDMLYKDMNLFNMKSAIYTTEMLEIKPLILKNELVLKDITFYYPDNNKPVIDNINLKIKANTTIGFVGTTGSGKTTLANIILGLLIPESGQILSDGIEINEERMPSWQKNLGYIPQDINLYDDTVEQNIAFGISKDKIDADAIELASKTANIHDFIVNELILGYKTIIGERGIRLSGGQRQRIGIARALYRNPGVLVLDEATSALDNATEQEVFQAIQNLARTKTLIIIAHRLTTVKECDVIYILERGKIIGTGTYDELLETSKEFMKLAKIQ
jgi:ATP-binding cassette, subfamily B, bacterial PglK